MRTHVVLFFKLVSPIAFSTAIFLSGVHRLSESRTVFWPRFTLDIDPRRRPRQRSVLLCKPMLCTSMAGKPTVTEVWLAPVPCSSRRNSLLASWQERRGLDTFRTHAPPTRARGAMCGAPTCVVERRP
ncbi:hypothetical protein L226DRAFT_354536 [Lentinus tigrinus ALCF2SS1-7]|uniref:uncharacterized protein n=1 Tax=Lentinus tigrinus ALCF2SS1-7 TaxID=1328758 RepID=UPI001165E74B|nr:hypothetical protein L226DRAFT_354536 [Lentinus tigrinus ALCF2SS1-7]